ncbi:hypothetical protein [Butyrivibrio sp. FCS014]|uniref:hypothetical protein n=1 Tax=Butyrivibrio sp. FCS014 TaxID=1408304 RepID=UPI00046495DC|nr:hypothetical protein [Butyrivibrio sp. FCS014]
MGLFDEWEGFNYQEVKQNGRDEGEEIKLIKQVCKKMTLGQDVAQIARDLVEDEETIQEIYDVAGKYAPEFDPEKIYEELAEAGNLVES